MSIGKTLEHYIGLALASSGAKVDSLMRTDLRTACKGLDNDIETLLKRTDPGLPVRYAAMEPRKPSETVPPPPAPLLPVTGQEDAEFDEVPERVGSMEHAVKSWPASFADISTLRKGFDVRVNDRNYQAGDILRVREFVPAATPMGGNFTGRSCRRRITFVLAGEVARLQGLRPLHCVLGLEEVRE